MEEAAVRELFEESNLTISTSDLQKRALITFTMQESLKLMHVCLLPLPLVSMTFIPIIIYPNPLQLPIILLIVANRYVSPAFPFLVSSSYTLSPTQIGTCL